MSFCCGEDMLLTIASIRSHSTTFTNVPVLFCVTCEKIMTHPDVELEFEMLKEYAHGDRVGEVDLKPYLSSKKQEYLYDQSNHAEGRRIDHVLQEHIDHALDLYTLAASADDPAWKDEIINRLLVLKEKKNKGNLKQKR